jgi:hypothetical protein
MTNVEMLMCIFIGLMKVLENFGLFLVGMLLVAMVYHDHIHISFT